MAEEHLRDMAIGVSVQADNGVLVQLNREMMAARRQARAYGRDMAGSGYAYAKAQQGMVKESQAFVKEASRQNDMIRQLAKTSGATATQLANDWQHMSDEMKKSLIRNHNDMRKYRQQLMGTENDMWKLSNQMGHYTGTTNDFMSEVAALGKEHKKITEQMINSNVSLRQSYIQQAATVMNLSTTSSKIAKVYDDTGNALYKVNKPLLAVTDRMEQLAKQGNPVVVALNQLGPNASMKELQDRINLINTGIMRQQMLLMIVGAAWLGFTAIVAKSAMGPDVAKNLKAQSDALAEYQKALEQRTQSIANTWGMFGQIQLEKTNPRRLYLNLEQQLKVMQSWQTNLNTLAQKGLDQGFVQELRKMGPSAASEIAALTQMSDKGLKGYVQIWKDIHAEARKAAITELEKLKQETAAKIQALKDSLKPLGIAVYEFKNTWATALAPFVDFWGLMASYVVRAGTRVGEFVQKLNEVSPWITKIAGMFAYLTVTMLLVLTPMAVGIGYIQGMKVAFTAAWTAIKPLALALSSVGGTAMLVAGGVIVLGAALYLLWTRSEKFRTAVINGWTAIKQTAVNVWGSIKPLIMDAIDAIVAFGQQKLTQLKTFWKENGDQIFQAAKNVWTPIGAVIKTVLGVVWSVMKFVWPAVLLLIKSVWGNIKGVIDGGLNIIMGAVKIFSGLFTGDFRKMWEGVKQVFFGAVQFIWNFIQLNMFGKILGAGKAFVLSFRSVLVSMWTGIRNSFTSSITWIKNVFVNGFSFLRTTSDSLFRGVTVGAIRFVTGFLGWISRLIGSARVLFGSLRATGEGIFTSFFLTIRTTIQTIGTTIKNGFGKAFGPVWTTFKTVKQGVVSFVQEIISPFSNMVVQTRLIFGLFKAQGIGIFRSLGLTLKVIVKDMVSMISTRFKSIVDMAAALPGKIGTGIKGMAKHAMGGIKHLANTMVAGLAQGVNGVGDGINWVFKKIGVDEKHHVPEWTPPKYAGGTNYHIGGPAILGDGRGSNAGPELYRTPRGDVGLSPGRDTLMNLPKGTQVLSATNTRKVLGGLPAYNQGNTTIGDFMAGAGSAVKNATTGALQGVKNIGTRVKDIAFDAFEVFSDPTSFMAKAWDKFGGVFPKMDGSFGQMGLGALKMIKDKALGYVNGLLPSFSMGGGDMGGVLASALSWTQRKTKYVWGGGRKQSDIDKGWFDCSGFIYAMLKQNGFNLSVGNTDTLLGQGAPVDRSQLIPGDLVFFDTYKKNGHVGFYTGNNQFVGSQSSTGVAVESMAPGTYFGDRYRGVNRRIAGVSGGGGAVPNVSGGAAVWRPMILQAAARMKEAVTPAQVQGIIAQIHRESKGDQRIFQSPAVNDVNMRNGNPARGLLQYIPSTFKSYMVSGHTNILSGVDQLLAFFNNTNWRKDLPYGRRGWGPTGARKYANGGMITSPHLGLVGEAGPEAIIPLSISRRARGLKLLAQTAAAMGVGITSKTSEYTPSDPYVPTQTASAGGGTRVIHLEYKPGEVNITVQGGGEVPQSIEDKFKALQEEHYRKIQALLLEAGGEMA